MVTLFLVLGLNNASASPSKAQNAYTEGRYRDALNEYDRLAHEKPSDPRLRYNAGAAALAAKEFDRATSHLEAALGGTDPKLNQSAHYNLGLSQFGAGEAKTEPNEKIQNWERSISEFQHAIELDPKDEDAKANQSLVRQKLEELKRQQQEQKKDNKNQDQNKDQKDQKDQEKKDNKSEKKDGKDQKDNKDQSPNPDKEEKDNKKDSAGQKSEEQNKQDQAKQQQQQAKNDSKDPAKTGENGQPKPINKQEGNKSDAARAEEAADAKAAAAGIMTEKQARQLLETQRGEEQSMVFLPAEKATKPKGNRSFKNW
jgi:Ca-activated chloride channel family protein